MKEPRICSAAGCYEEVENSNGKCRVHRRKAQKAADKRNGRVRGSRWSALRRVVLKDNPYCSCLDCEGCLGTCEAMAVEVDHIIPLAFGGHPTMRDNLQGLCHSCHNWKTWEEQRIIKELGLRRESG
jgi:Restriction endonuclease